MILGCNLKDDALPVHSLMSLQRLEIKHTEVSPIWLYRLLSQLQPSSKLKRVVYHNNKFNASKEIDEARYNLRKLIPNLNFLWGGKWRIAGLQIKRTRTWEWILVLRDLSTQNNTQ